jgi:hypothetical protein
VVELAAEGGRPERSALPCRSKARRKAGFVVVPRPGPLRRRAGRFPQARRGDARHRLDVSTKPTLPFSIRCSVKHGGRMGEAMIELFRSLGATRFDVTWIGRRRRGEIPARRDACRVEPEWPCPVGRRRPEPDEPHHTASGRRLPRYLHTRPGCSIGWRRPRRCCALAGNAILGKTGKPDRVDTATRMAQDADFRGRREPASLKRESAQRIDAIDELMRIVAAAEPDLAHRANERKFADRLRRPCLQVLSSSSRRGAAPDRQPDDRNRPIADLAECRGTRGDPQ